VVDLSNILDIFQVFKYPELEDFFAQLGTYQILMDLLFENERYQDILDVFEIIKLRQHQEAKYPKNVVILTFAACFKLVSLCARILLLLRCCYSLEISAMKSCMCFLGNYFAGPSGRRCSCKLCL
jgi:hypothetical protein